MVFLLLFLLFFFVIRKNENGLVYLFDIKIILIIFNMDMYLMLMWTCDKICRIYLNASNLHGCLGCFNYL